MGVWFFFFQAEDGIRDLVRSRGLGDVYKRQLMTSLAGIVGALLSLAILFALAWQGGLLPTRLLPVSYTHLTLPTSDLV